MSRDNAFVAHRCAALASSVIINHEPRLRSVWTSKMPNLNSGRTRVRIATIATATLLLLVNGVCSGKRTGASVGYTAKEFNKAPFISLFHNFNYSAPKCVIKNIAKKKCVSSAIFIFKNLKRCLFSLQDNLTFGCLCVIFFHFFLLLSVRLLQIYFHSKYIYI